MRAEKLTGMKLTYVPFTGAAPQMTAFLGGHTDACMGNSDDLTRFKDKLRVLAFATETRFPHFPDAPTFKELGYDMVEGTERGVAVPPGTPKEIIDKLEKVFLEICKDPAIVEDFKEAGIRAFGPGARGEQGQHREADQGLRRSGEGHQGYQEVVSLVCCPGHGGKGYHEDAAFCRQIQRDLHWPSWAWWSSWPPTDHLAHRGSPSPSHTPPGPGLDHPRHGFSPCPASLALPIRGRGHRLAESGGVGPGDREPGEPGGFHRSHPCLWACLWRPGRM